MSIRFVVFAFAGLFISLQDLSPRLPITLLNGLYKFFEENNLPHESNPVWGAIAIDSGICQSLRFFGNLDLKYGFKDRLTGIINPNLRDYVHDKGLDPVASIVVTLFPSAGGTFSAQTNSDSNLGSMLPQGARGGEIIALLVSLIDELTEITKPTDPKDKTKKEKETSTINKEIKTSVNKCMTECKKGCNNSICNSVINQIAEYFRLKDSDLKSFYPSNILRQLLLAFFFEHFNTAQDLEAFVNKYGMLFFAQQKVANEQKAAKKSKSTKQEFVSDDSKNKKLEKPFQATKITKERWSEIQKELENQEKVNYEQAFQLATLPKYFKSVTGYSEKPLGFGISNVWHQDSDGSLSEMTNQPFADCLESAIRHLINVLCFDQDKGGVLYEHLQDKRLREYFEIYHSQDDFNRGDMQIRTAWNKVLSCREDILYKRKSSNDAENNNEVTTTIKNITNILAYLAGQPTVSIEEKQNYTEVEQEKIIEHLTKFGKIICNQIALDENGALSENIDSKTKIESVQIQGPDIIFNIKKSGTTKEVKLYALYQKHAELSMQNEVQENVVFNLDQNLNRFSPEIGLLKKQYASLFYRAFSINIDNQSEWLYFLKDIKTEFNEKDIPNGLHSVCRFFVNNSNWQDEKYKNEKDLVEFFLEKIDNISRHNYVLELQKASKIEELSEKLLENIFFVSISDWDINNEDLSEKQKKLLSQLKKSITISNFSSENFIFDGSLMPKVEYITLNYSNVKSIFGKFENLLFLSCFDCKRLTLIDGDFPKLSQIDLSLSIVEEIRGDFNSLEVLSFEYCKTIKTIDGFFPMLRKLDLKNYLIQHIHGDFENLRELSLANCHSIKTINAKFPALEKCEYIFPLDEEDYEDLISQFRSGVNLDFEKNDYEESGGSDDEQSDNEA